MMKKKHCLRIHISFTAAFFERVIDANIRIIRPSSNAADVVVVGVKRRGGCVQGTFSYPFPTRITKELPTLHQ